MLASAKECSGVKTFFKDYLGEFLPVVEKTS